MELTNEFRVDVPVDEAWNVLTDVERIAPCMPGAELQEVEGEEFRGIVKVKVGPISAQYKGTARFLEKDADAKKAVLKAEGRDTRGQGNANATITATLAEDGSGTSVKVITDLTVTGKVAQFGRGVLADVSSKLLGQFVACLHDDLLGESAAPGAAPSAAPSTAATPAPSGAPSSGNGATGGGVKTATPAAETNGQTTSYAKPEESAASAASATSATSATSAEEVRRIESKPAQPVDLLDAAGVPVAKRAIPVVAGVLVILWFLRRRQRRARR